MRKALEGSTLRSDSGADKNLYGQELDAKQIVRENKVAVPAAGKPLVDLLQQISPKHVS
jgi:lipid-binding SYLF domain-containing protein